MTRLASVLTVLCAALFVVLLVSYGSSGGTEDGSGGVPGQTAGRLSRVHGRYGIEADFDAAYVDTHADRVTVRVPEVFELANIAFAITDYGMESPYRVFKDSGYYEEVLDHFGAYRDHPLIAEIEFSDRRVGDYFEWQTSSLAYEFEGRRIVAGDHYAPTGDAAGWFLDQLGLLEDFAAATDFREFYAAHRRFYERQIASYREKVPVRRMWRWLEAEFRSFRCVRCLARDALGVTRDGGALRRSLPGDDCLVCRALRTASGDAGPGAAKGASAGRP